MKWDFPFILQFNKTKNVAALRQHQLADKPCALAQGLSNKTKTKSKVKGDARSADRFSDE